MSSARNLLQKAAREIGTRHRALRLEGVPHWVTPGDIRRMAERAGAIGIRDAYIESEKGIQTGTAFVEFEAPSLTRKAADLLKNAQISGIPITIAGYVHARSPKFHKRTRIDPLKPIAPTAPATAVIYGIPKSFKLKDVRAFLHEYKFATFGTPEEAYERVFVSSGEMTRWAIRLQSMSDAWRLVRHLHMRRFRFGQRGETLIGARVVY
ncbi:hypothetical protein PIIN_00763 [Serendipita indica DSM 11827]|uniref:RRM domain-containing protein n=1 Tax=Serendipita indica (strain DSM 11827) TaxID=1109443 RepID=G4T6J1_SERID|nr:hypothetical protein PIIN_00763 [Serendipita indica DSM 11827]